jgi:hypothetical protein
MADAGFQVLDFAAAFGKFAIAFRLLGSVTGLGGGNCLVALGQVAEPPMEVGHVGGPSILPCLTFFIEPPPAVLPLPLIEFDAAIMFGDDIVPVGAIGIQLLSANGE